MGRFINLGIAIVNTSYIIRVEMESDGSATSLHLQEELRYDQSHSMST